MWSLHTRTGKTSYVVEVNELIANDERVADELIIASFSVHRSPPVLECSMEKTGSNIG